MYYIMHLLNYIPSQSFNSQDQVAFSLLLDALSFRPGSPLAVKKRPSIFIPESGISPLNLSPGDSILGIHSI
jgi:hypothetical protein